ncbi:MAG: YggS family pyridoxal phosphate-dependent enzyme [Candidatus Binatia bacterium]
MIDVAANLAAVRDRIARAAERAGRDPASVRLVAAAKTKPAEMVRAAIAAGLTDVGENYVQEAAAKRAAVGDRARWHLIGHLQRNKAARAVEIFDCIQTLDSAALGAALSRHAVTGGRTLSVLIEVRLGGETSKSGVEPDALPGLLAALRLPGLAVEGLMTVPPPGDPESARPHFRALREWRDRLGLRELSMGMTDDFEVAIEEGRRWCASAAPSLARVREPRRGAEKGEPAMGGRTATGRVVRAATPRRASDSSVAATWRRR